MYTFIVLSYNQEKYIVEHLESIKWQIQTYKQIGNVQLILADDCSSDNTVSITRKWLRRNASLFRETDICVCEKNSGTATNTANAFRNIKGEYFFYAAADDIYSVENVFQYLNQLDYYDVIDAMAFSFDDTTYQLVNYFEKDFRRKIVKMYMSNKHIRTYSAAAMIVGGPTYAFRTDYINESNMEFLKTFQMMEDQPLTHILFNRKNIRFHTTIIPLILQRNTPGSLTRSANNSTVKVKCRSDIDRLCLINSKDNDMSIRWSSLVYHLWNLTGNNLFLMVNPYYQFKALNVIIHKKEIETIYIKQIAPRIIESQRHLEMIQALSKEFYTEVLREHSDE